MKAPALAGIAVGASVCAVLSAGGASAGPTQVAVDDPIIEALERASHAAYSGVRVAMSWTEAGTYMEMFRIEHAAGQASVEHLSVGGDTAVRVLATGTDRWMSTGAAWETIGGATVPTTWPAARDKYAITSDATAELGRPAIRVELLAGGGVREVFILDDATGAFLRRESYLTDGALWRLQAYTVFADGAPRMAVPPMDPAPAPLRLGTGVAVSGALSTGDVELSAPAPETLPNGYMLLDALRRDDGVQLLYGDGVYAFSVFAMPGRVAWDELPQGALMREYGGARYARYCQATTQAIVWEGGHTTFVAAGDAPADDLLGALEALPHVPAPPSFGDRIRGTFDAVSFWN